MARGPALPSAIGSAAQGIEHTARSDSSRGRMIPISLSSVMQMQRATPFNPGAFETTRSPGTDR
jgi:hypothetical protein